MHRNRNIQTNTAYSSTSDTPYVISSKPEKPGAVLSGLRRGCCCREGLRQRDTEHTKQMHEGQRAPGSSSQTKHRFLVFIKALQALLLLCNRVCLSLPESKELQLSHFPLKAIQWRGCRGGGALALTIAGAASPAALSALIMCHTLL